MIRKKSYHHGDLRAALIAAANKILLRDGADALSLRAIAAEVGVSPMAPYSHFKNKKELVVAISEKGFDRLADSMGKATKKVESQRDIVVTYGACYLSFAIKNPQLYRLMVGQVETRGRKKVGGRDVARAVPSPELVGSSERPFVLLREAYLHRTDDAEKAKNQALGAWSLVHGLAALIIEGRVKIPRGQSPKDFLKSITPR